jgi:hypothetical protein
MRSLRLIAVVLLHSAFVISLQAATFTVSGTTLQLNLTAANETVAITAGATNYTFALTGGTWSGTDGAEATGNGTPSLSAAWRCASSTRRAATPSNTSRFGG